MLTLVPILALIQKLFFLGSGRFYIEHLVLTVHNQSFLFLSFVLLFILDLLTLPGIGVISATADFLESCLNLWVIVYLFWSLKVFFQQGYFLTGVKFLAMSLVYSSLFLTGLLTFVLIEMFLY